MDTAQFDKAMITATFQRAALVGWRDTTLIDAAGDAALDPARVRIRFPNKMAVLLRFGSAADQAVLAASPAEGTPRERLFDLLMARFDQLQQHRDGMIALIEALRSDPVTSLVLYGATVRSMRWMLDAAGVRSGGVLGGLRVQGLVAIWFYALRAWEADAGTDLPSTMAALDRGLDRAIQAEEMLPQRHGGPVVAAEHPVPPNVPVHAIPAAPDGTAVL